MAEATAPTLRPMRAIEVEKGPASVLAVVGAIFYQADKITGGRCDAEELELLTKMTIQHFRHRTIASLVLAIKEGISRTDEDGKVYGKLDWPKVKLWLDAHEQAIMESAANEHGARVVKHDNLGADWMDRQEHAAGAKDRMIEHLKRKLDAKQNER